LNTKRKRLLLAGGGHADIPLIKAAKNLGYYVITTGNRPDDLGHGCSDEYRSADFSNCEAIYNLSKELNISAICACCNDFSALSAAYTAERLGLPGHDSYVIAETIHHKDLYRQFALKNGIPSPQVKGFSIPEEALKYIEQITFPVIIKPVDLTGGKGISTAVNVEEGWKAIQKAFSTSRAKRIVIEEFVEGSRHGFSAFLYKGKIVFYISDNEHYFLNPYLVSAASVPGNTPFAAEQELISESEKVASLLLLKDGIFHVQYILRDNKPIIVEICRRAPGDLYIKLVEHATGVDYSSYIVKASSGIDCGALKPSSPNGYFVRHCIMSAKPGKVKTIDIDSSIRTNIIDQITWWKKGDLIHDIMTTKFGIVFLKFESMKEMTGKVDQLHHLIRVETE